MKLSIVIPSHRRADLLRLCLTSVQRFAPPNTEVIVVDDGSRDAVVSRAAAEFAGVKVIRREKAGGFCVAANAGIAAATAPVLELLNDDAEATTGWADAALRWFADPRIVAVAPLVLQNNPDRIARGLPPLIDTAGDEYDMGGFATKRSGSVGVGECGRQGEKPGPQDPVSLSPCLPVSHSHSLPQSVSTNHAGTSPPLPLSPSLPLLQSESTNHAGTVWGASAAAAFYRRDALLRAGGFPEHFKAYFEDVDLSFRLRQLGGEVMYDPASVVWHRVSSSYGKRPSRRTLEQQSCNEERVFWRNVRGLDRARWLPRHAAVLSGKAVKRFQEGTLLPWLLGRVRAALT